MTNELLPTQEVVSITVRAPLWQNKTGMEHGTVNLCRYSARYTTLLQYHVVHTKDITYQSRVDQIQTAVTEQEKLGLCFEWWIAPEFGTTAAKKLVTVHLEDEDVCESHLENSFGQTVLEKTNYNTHCKCHNNLQDHSSHADHGWEIWMENAYQHTTSHCCSSILHTVIVQM